MTCTVQMQAFKLQATPGENLVRYPQRLAIDDEGRAEDQLWYAEM